MSCTCVCRECAEQAHCAEVTEGLGACLEPRSNFDSPEEAAEWARFQQLLASADYTTVDNLPVDELRRAEIAAIFPEPEPERIEWRSRGGPFGFRR